MYERIPLTLVFAKMVYSSRICISTVHALSARASSYGTENVVSRSGTRSRT